MFIYVAVGESGLIKVGKTIMLDKKYLTKALFRRRGELMVDMQMFESSNHDDDECLLIRAMHRMGTLCHGQEWFRGVSFDAAKKEASAIVSSMAEARLIAKKKRKAKAIDREHKRAIVKKEEQ